MNMCNTVYANDALIEPLGGDKEPCLCVLVLGHKCAELDKYSLLKIRLTIDIRISPRDYFTRLCKTSKNIVHNFLNLW